jgi:hypothetical protein
MHHRLFIRRRGRALHCTPINDRCYSNEKLAGALRKTDRVVCSMPLGSILAAASGPRLEEFAARRASRLVASGGGGVLLD